MTQNNAPKWHSLVTGTADQIAALKSEARLTVVSAGAGTGKTQTLSQRFAWLLASDPSCGAGEILVLTFTKKAAAEMLGRIKETLAAWHNAYPDELAHLGERIEHMDDAYISTIHAFAMKLIRESGLALDIDPAAAIMPAPKEEIWWQEFAAALSSASFGKISAALPEEWRARAGELFRSPDFVDALNALTPEAFADAARSCAEKLYCAGQSADELWRCDGSALEASAASMAPLRAEIYELWMGEIFPALASEGLLDCGKKANDTQRRLADFREKWTARAVGPDDGEALAEFCQGLFDEALKPAPRGKIKTAVEALLGRPLTEWRGETQEALALLEPPSEAEKRINGLLCKACAVGWACWDEFRRREGLLSISDLIYYASKVVRSSPEYRTKFKHIMVDEFQDTDPLQNELIESLWGGGEGGATLFVVGDQKQSIYRFRHADLGLFRDYTARALNNPEAAKYIVLDQNFRTAKGLLEKFNDLFGEMWGGADSPVLYERLAAPENDEASARRDGAEVPYPRFEALRAFAPYVEDKSERPDSAALRLRLYAGLGRKFAAMVEAQAPVWDKRAKVFRPVRWRDFAVLVQTRAEYSDIERAFERIGLPYVLSTSKDYFGRGETGDLVNLVSLLASPDDPLFLAGWLASPFSGVESAEAEALIEAALEKRERGSALPLAEAVTRARPDVMARLDEMRRRALLGGVSEVLLGLLKTPQFLENYAGMRRLRVNANVVYLANIAAEYERSEGKSLRGCAEYLLTASSSGSAKEEPELFGDDVDAVRVMTVHASKGLEFPVVAMTLSDKKGAALPSIIVSKKYGAAAKDYPEYLEGAGEARGDGRTAAYRWERHEENAAQREELERLWYVGFTRARDRLILCGIYKEPKKGGEREAELPRLDNRERALRRIHRFGRGRQERPEVRRVRGPRGGREARSEGREPREARAHFGLGLRAALVVSRGLPHDLPAGARRGLDNQGRRGRRGLRRHGALAARALGLPRRKPRPSAAARARPRMARRQLAYARRASLTVPLGREARGAARDARTLRGDRGVRASRRARRRGGRAAKGDALPRAAERHRADRRDGPFLARRGRAASARLEERAGGDGPVVLL